MVQSNYSVVALSIGSQALHRDRVNKHELSIAIYIQGKNTFGEVMYPWEYFTLNFIINEIFSVK